MAQAAPTPKLDRATLRAIPAGVWTLGMVSLLNDISSDLVHSLLPLYLVMTLGASVLVVGIIEGAAEATASVLKLFSGAISDWTRRRKALTVAGYALSAATKPILPLASSIGWIVTARVADRVGKGIRSSPRDALIADMTPPALRGAAFGLRQSLDTVGAVIGPLLAILLMWAFSNNIRAVLWIAILPVSLAVVLLIINIKEQMAPAHERARFPLHASEIRRLPALYWLVVAGAALFTLARFSEAFLVLRAQSTGLPLALVPLVIVIMNVVFAVSAYPAGVASDTTGRARILAIGLAVLIGADVVLAAAPGGVVGVFLGTALWGLHMGLTQGLLSALVVDSAPADLRGTAFGMFNLAIGLAALLASVIAGALWSTLGPQGTFIAGALFASLALVMLLALLRPLGRGSKLAG